MANLKVIKTRMQAILKTSSITKAMYNISFSKIGNASKVYFNNLKFMEKLEELMYGAAVTASDTHPLLSVPKEDSRLYIILTGDKGLAGSYHNQLFKFLDNELKSSNNNYLLVIGKKGYFEAVRRKWNIINSEVIPSRDDIATMILSDYSKLVKEYMMDKKVEKVYTVYNHYISSTKCEPKVDLVLPLDPDKVDKDSVSDYIYDGNPDEILEKIANLFIESKLYFALADAKVSEHSSRMMAMKSATDNADEIALKLRIIYNQVRQQSITNELIDVINGSDMEGL